MAEHTDNACLIMRVMKAARGAMNARYMQHLLPHQLTIAQFKVLQHLHWHASQGGLTIGELSEHLGLANSTVSGIVDRLERDNWTERMRSDTDRRKIKVMLTDNATELFQQIPKDAEEFWSRTIGCLSAEEQDALLESLRKLKNVMEKPTWPSYEQMHAPTTRNIHERIQAYLEEIYAMELNYIGKRLVLARIAEESGESEIAAYLKQTASEEINHALHAAKLLGKNKEIRQNLTSLVKDEIVSQEAREDLMKLVTEEGDADVIDFLKKTMEDEAKHKQWFTTLLRRCERKAEGDPTLEGRGFLVNMVSG